MELTPLRFIASAPRGFGELLARELPSFGAADVRERALGVEFSGTVEVAYRTCLESRVASRVFLEVARFDAPTDESFYEAIRAIDWRPHVDPSRTLACDFSGRHPALTHTRFGALRLKDGICDQLRDVTGSRPDIGAYARTESRSVSVRFGVPAPTQVVTGLATPVPARPFRESSITASL